MLTHFWSSLFLNKIKCSILIDKAFIRLKDVFYRFDSFKRRILLQGIADQFLDKFNCQAVKIRVKGCPKKKYFL